jgi:hypothetical protein
VAPGTLDLDLPAQIGLVVARVFEQTALIPLRFKRHVVYLPAPGRHSSVRSFLLILDARLDASVITDAPGVDEREFDQTLGDQVLHTFLDWTKVWIVFIEMAGDAGGAEQLLARRGTKHGVRPLAAERTGATAGR